MKANSIHDIIAMLHIDVIGGEIEARHVMIRESYKIPKYVANDYEDFKAIVSNYYQYHFSMWIGAGPIMPDDMAFGEVNKILKQMPRPDSKMARVQSALESEGGFVSSVKRALYGRDGGLIGVIDSIAESIKKDAVKRYVRTVFLECVNPINFDMKVKFMREYLETYGKVILAGDLLLSPYELAANLEAVIQNHVRLVNEFRKSLQ